MPNTNTQNIKCQYSASDFQTTHPAIKLSLPKLSIGCPTTSICSVSLIFPSSTRSAWWYVIFKSSRMTPASCDLLTSTGPCVYKFIISNDHDLVSSFKLIIFFRGPCNNECVHICHGEPFQLTTRGQGP